MNGQLTATLIADEADLTEFADVVPVLEEKAGRLLINGYPTGVEVCDAMYTAAISATQMHEALQLEPWH
ncbi:putative aldehyde dehydrogenase domain protein [Acinetobacter sp. AR_0276]|nr:putative aldehyde dehydrogenase domain protein [Acinetobacter sp. AR_0276]